MNTHHNLKMKTVTIISGYYNRENHVDESVESIINQDFDDYEVIIFDDASTDNTLKQLKKYKSKRLHIVAFPKNIGLVRGLSTILREVTSRYIAIHGSGDISYKTRISHQVNTLDSDQGIVIVSSNYVNHDIQNGIKKIVKHKPVWKRHELYLKNPVNHGGVMFRNGIYQKVGGYRTAFQYSQDSDLWFRMTNHGDIAIPEAILYERIVQPDGVSYSPKKLIKQKQYGLLARIASLQDENEQSILLRNVEKNGIDTVISHNHEKIKKDVFYMFHVLVAKGLHKDLGYILDRSKGFQRLYYRATLFVIKFILIRKTISLFYWAHQKLK